MTVLPGPGTWAVRRMTARLSGLLVVLTSPAWLVAAVVQHPVLSLWWNLLALAVVGLPAVWLVVESWRVGDVRPPAAVLAGGVALCLLLWPLGVVDVPAARSGLPWLWLIAPATTATLATLGSLRVSLLYGLGTGALHALVRVMDVGGAASVEFAVLEGVLLLTLALGPVVLVGGASRAAGRLDALADEAAAASAEASRAAAALGTRRELDAVVHDTVLAALHTAVRDPGDPDLPQLAERALQTFRSPGPRADDAGAGDVGRLLQASLAAVAPHADLDVREGPSVPGHVARAMADAALEAARNARRHGGGAGAPPDITVLVAPTPDGHGLQVTVRDDGIGFDPSLVPPQRMGLAVSVRGRMQRVGGRADVVTATGSGTTVRLTWEPAAPADPADPAGPAAPPGAGPGKGTGAGPGAGPGAPPAPRTRPRR
ncbi:ATP-binding protein [Aquipuribacter hungaricus]|uniref:ATP-binding protein n=2 Tax=Aquipuribacter hungaricus TaxID=545624 RepID=A0ABV7WBH7_9MICO